MLIMIQHPEKKAGPVLATGVHAELLADLENTATWLIKLIERERSGTYDGFGQNFWTVSDSVLNAAHKIAELADQRASFLRDAGPR
jgi:hypothetical protein